MLMPFVFIFLAAVFLVGAVVQHRLRNNPWGVRAQACCGSASLLVGLAPMQANESTEIALSKAALLLFGVAFVFLLVASQRWRRPRPKDLSAPKDL
jgi:uncharacterized membrane protein